MNVAFYIETLTQRCRSVKQKRFRRARESAAGAVEILRSETTVAPPILTRGPLGAFARSETCRLDFLARWFEPTEALRDLLAGGDQLVLDALAIGFVPE